MPSQPSQFNPEEFVNYILSHMNVTDGSSNYYDPQKAHDYYIRTRQLKGRQPVAKESPVFRARSNSGSSSTVRKVTKSASSVSVQRQQLVNGRVASLQKRLVQLEVLLKGLLDKAAKKATSKAVSKNSGQTAKQKQSAVKSSAKYYDKNKAAIAAKAKEAYAKANPDSTLSIDQVKAKIVTIRAELKTAIANARGQLSNPQTVKSR